MPYNIKFNKKYHLFEIAFLPKKNKNGDVWFKTKVIFTGTLKKCLINFKKQKKQEPQKIFVIRKQGVII